MGPRPGGGAGRTTHDRWLDGEIVPREHDRWLWATAADMRNLRWAPADVPLVPRVAERLG
jgi:hypothetical protein